MISIILRLWSFSNSHKAASFVNWESSRVIKKRFINKEALVLSVTDVTVWALIWLSIEIVSNGNLYFVWYFLSDFITARNIGEVWIRFLNIEIIQSFRIFKLRRLIMSRFVHHDIIEDGLVFLKLSNYSIPFLFS